jgi:hypothetical protein
VQQSLLFGQASEPERLEMLCASGIQAAEQLVNPGVGAEFPRVPNI